MTRLKALRSDLAIPMKRKYFLKIKFHILSDGFT